MAEMKMRSCRALVMPMALTGRQALSVDTPTTVSTGRSFSLTARMMLAAPSTLVRVASSGKYSQDGTCLRAAALITMSAPRRVEHNDP